MTISICSLLLLCVALSTDTFTAGLSYSAQKVRVPVSSMIIISLISGSMFMLSLSAGEKIAGLIPHEITALLSFIILMALAFYKLYDALPAKFHHTRDLTTASFSEKVNKKDTAVLSSTEAATLSVILSIDSITAGVSTGMPVLPPAACLFISAAIHFLALNLGMSAGKALFSKTSGKFSWLSAALFFLLALSRLLK